MPNRTDHVSSLEGWRRNSKKAKRRVLPQELPIQAWLMCHMRFLPAAESCRAFAAFGGLCAQFNLLSVALNISVTEGFGFGLAYFRILSTRLEETARQRAVSAEEFYRLLPFGQLGVKEQARRECALSTRGDYGKGFPRDKGAKQRKGSHPAHGVPLADAPSTSQAFPIAQLSAHIRRDPIRRAKGNGGLKRGNAPFWAHFRLD